MDNVSMLQEYALECKLEYLYSSDFALESGGIGDKIANLVKTAGTVVKFFYKSH